MSAAREEILGRVRAALQDVPGAETPGEVSVPRDYRRRDESSASALRERFTDRVRDYHATVHPVTASRIGVAAGDVCVELGLRRVVVPVGFPREWLPDRVEVIEDRMLSVADLDEVDGALTGCAAAIADTGTLVLDGQGRSGRRAITLVPDHHICVVTAEQVTGLVPEAIARVGPSVAAHRLPITLVSGPSASSDIELSRVEGVHGPRHLVVLLVEDG